jgi:ketosteroid isomerase-like protein
VPENLDLVRSIVEAWERGDFTSTEWPDPEIEFIFAGELEQRRSTGVAGMREVFRDFLAQWKGLRAVAEAYRQIDDTRVLVLFRGVGHGKASGLSINQPSTATLFDVQGGKVTKLALYGDRQRALADLGLKE